MMATMTGMDAKTRERLIGDYGATEGLLDALEDGGYKAGEIESAFLQMAVAQVAARIGYDLNSDLAQQSAAAPSPAAGSPSRSGTPKASARSAAPTRKRQKGNTYRTGLQFVSLTFATVLAIVLWRVDGYFGVAFLQGIPGLTGIPNTWFWPPVWTWLIGLGVSAMQGGFWPHMAQVDAQGEIVGEASSAQEIATWLIVLFVNIASSALGMMPSIAGLNVGGGVVIPTEGRWLWATAWTFAAILALYPEWAMKLFGGKLWNLLVPDSLKHRIRAIRSGIAAVRGVMISLLPTDPRARMVVGGVAGAVVLLLAWNIFA
jgi:hypothetical protein